MTSPSSIHDQQRFTWKIEKISSLCTNKLYSRTFYIGSYKWRVLLFPKGNNTNHLSMYLDVPDSTVLPSGWTRHAQFSLALLDQIHNQNTVKKETQHEFNSQESDWGFTSFMPLSELHDPSKGFLVNDTIVVEADFTGQSHDLKTEKIICNADEKDIAEHLRIRLKKEQEEKEQKRKEKAKAHLYTIIKVARDEDLLEQIGRDIYFDLVDHDKVRSFRIQKQMPFNLFKEEVAKEFGIPVQFQRFWLWAKRQNHTYRPHQPLTPQEETQSVGQLREVSNKASNAELKLFLEVELGQDLKPIPPTLKSKVEMLLFFKQYDPLKEELRYVGRLFVKANGKPAEILTKLNELAGFSPDEEIELFEEIKFEPIVMCEHIDKNLTFRGSQLEDGDIICFQKSSRVESGEQCRCPDVPAFLEYVHNRQVVCFRSLEKPKEDEFCLELSKLHNYDDVVERVARHLGLDDPSKIRLTSHNTPRPIKYRGVEHLSDMLVHYNPVVRHTSDILYYEVLDIPLPKLRGLKTLKVAFHHATKDEVEIHSIRLPKQSTVGDVINDLKTKVELSHPNSELRLLEVFYHSICKIFPLNEKIENINDQYRILRAEEIPEEEKNLGPHDRLIHVYHFMKDTAQNQVLVQNFGEPFCLVIHEGETLTEVKERIQKKLQVPDEEFSKWKFAFLSLGRPKYLQDSDVVSSRFQRRDVCSAWQQHLGLEHSDNTPKRSYVANQESGCREESQHPSQDNYSGNVEVGTTAISGEEVSSVESVWQDLVLTEAPSVDKEAERVHSESTLYTSFSGTSPSQQAAEPILGTQGSSEATPVGAASTITQAGGHASSGQASDNARGCNIGKVRFLSCEVSSEASLLLERIRDLHNDTFTKFSMKGHILQTMLLESFASFIESTSNTKVHDEEALRLAAISIEDFEQVGLDLSWLKQRLDEAKRVNKHTESLTVVDLCESALKVARANVCELEESLVKAKAEVEVASRDLPKSLGVDDSVLKDVV
ncbi:ubiquitin carboxyl-terminal hydrolase 12-like isoform X1 [Camellia sinensis]|uniref:ubiquitin carboxyl-terminal hydrolase 12-like isoform X1 n=1 Tax=Camellia sinensis TaxID=4442 RepID=UPI001036B230|nr:ubiquitin carboxyl-terminal hydrolase 12-like isoform X1 [Camellia sinensis]